MKHAYMLFASQKERVEKLLGSLKEFKGLGAATLTEVIQLETEDDALGMVLDALLGNLVIGSEEVGKKDGKKVPRECEKCGMLFEPRRSDQKVCGNCAKKKSRSLVNQIDAEGFRSRGEAN